MRRDWERAARLAQDDARRAARAVPCHAARENAFPAAGHQRAGPAAVLGIAPRLHRLLLAHQERDRPAPPAARCYEPGRRGGPAGGCGEGLAAGVLAVAAAHKAGARPLEHTAFRRTLRPTALLVPLVGFDSAGYRSGYGGGCYDRTLAGLDPRPLTIGIRYACSRLETTFLQPHNIPPDTIVTKAQGCRTTSATCWRSTRSTSRDVSCCTNSDSLRSPLSLIIQAAATVALQIYRICSAYRPPRGEGRSSASVYN